MRRFTVLACACCLSVIACSGSDGDRDPVDSQDVTDSDTVDGGDDDGDAEGDANVGDGGDTQTEDDPPVLLEPPARGFQVLTPEMTIPAGQATAICYYFRSPNTEPIAVNRFVSAMSASGYHLELYRTTDDVLPPGSVSTEGCSHKINVTDYPQWLYGVSGAQGELSFPADDDAGKPLALDVEPNTPMYLRVESSQAAPAPVAVQVALNVHTLEAGTIYTTTAPYVTYNGSISIPNGATAHVEGSACNHSDTALFWLVTMHAHKQATTVRILNDGYLVYEATNTGDPEPMIFTFYRFVGDITYECTYANATGRTVSDGDSPAFEEVCKMMGYFFEEGDKPVAPRACYTPGDAGGFTFPAWP